MTNHDHSRDIYRYFGAVHPRSSWRTRKQSGDINKRLMSLAPKLNLAQPKIRGQDPQESGYGQNYCPIVDVSFATTLEPPLDESFPTIYAPSHKRSSLHRVPRVKRHGDGPHTLSVCLLCMVYRGLPGEIWQHERARYRLNAPLGTYDQ